MRARVRSKPDGSFAMNLTAVALVFYRSEPADFGSERARREHAGFKARIDHAVACDQLVGRQRTLDQVLSDVCGLEAIERDMLAGRISNNEAMDRIFAVQNAAS
jgi:hypothetical protein